MPETSTTDFNRAMRDAKKQAGGVANEVSDAASQVADAATDAARKTASSFEKALRDTIENQPYMAVAIASDGFSAEHIARFEANEPSLRMRSAN
jgi:hypothetical protein